MRGNYKIICGKNNILPGHVLHSFHLHYHSLAHEHRRPALVGVWPHPPWTPHAPSNWPYPPLWCEQHTIGLIQPVAGTGRTGLLCRQGGGGRWGSPNSNSSSPWCPGTPSRYHQHRGKICSRFSSAFLLEPPWSSRSPSFPSWCENYCAEPQPHSWGQTLQGSKRLHEWTREFQYKNRSHSKLYVFC